LNSDKKQPAIEVENLKSDGGLNDRGSFIDKNHPIPRGEQLGLLNHRELENMRKSLLEIAEFQKQRTMSYFSSKLEQSSKEGKLKNAKTMEEHQAQG